MKGRKKNIKVYLLSENEQKNVRMKEGVSEIFLAFFLLSGILFSLQDLMGSKGCLIAAVFSGVCTVVIRTVFSANARLSKAVHRSLYFVSIFCLVFGSPFFIQGFLDFANRFVFLWNLRFGTEIGRFVVGSRAGIGQMFLWVLVSVWMSAFILSQIRRRCFYGLVTGIIGSLFVGFVLGQSRMWMATVCLLIGVFWMFVFYTAPRRKNGFRGIVCAFLMACFFLGAVSYTDGYNGSVALGRLKWEAEEGFERFRYGEDTLPQGNLKKAAGLFDGNGEETLQLEMEQPQELYLRGFVGGNYTGSRWEVLSARAYQEDYEGLFDWLGKKKFSPVAQYAYYDRLSSEAAGGSPVYTTVKVKNTGAYRKYAYIPATAGSWKGKDLEVKKDWQVQSKGFFGASEFSFDVENKAPTAADIAIAHWLADASGEEQNQYLDAEAVYHSFVEEFYMDVDEELKSKLKEIFFPDGTEMGFGELTTQIRKVLRVETRYVTSPRTVPDDKDFIRWFLEEYKKGNAVSYASAAVMAYRIAGYPARYAEGYYFSGDTSTQQGGKEIKLTTDNAHAWVEVYIAGVGWLPLEVVPGMYIETYTNQLIKGKPSYQINSSQDEQGIETEEGGAKEHSSEKKEKQKFPKMNQRNIIAWILLSAYVCFAIYLFLELQRIIRLGVRKKREGKDLILDQYVRHLMVLLQIGNVKGDFSHPLELSEQIEREFPNFAFGEYHRVVELIQKVCFGGKELSGYEKRTLKIFADSLGKALYKKRGIVGKALLRYRYLVDMY